MPSQAVPCTGAMMGMGMTTAGIYDCPLAWVLMRPTSALSLKSQMVAS